MAEKKALICYKCQKKLAEEKTQFTYLGQSFFADVLRCPQCGEVYISEDLAKSRMAEVEMLLEDK